MTTETAQAPHKLDTRMKLVIASIALGATVVGAVIGAAASVYGANRNADAQANTAAFNYRHTQLQNAFTTFIGDDNTLGQSESDLELKIGTMSTNDYLAEIDKIAILQTKLATDMQVLDMISVPTTVTDAGNLFDDWAQALSVLQSALGKDSLPQDDLDKFGNFVRKAGDDLQTVIDVMRTDLCPTSQTLYCS